MILAHNSFLAILRWMQAADCPGEAAAERGRSGRIPPASRKFASVLVKIPNFSGDIILAVPSLQYVQALPQFAPTNFYFIVPEDCIDLFCATGIRYKEIIPEKKIQRGWRLTGKVRALRKLLAGRIEFDLGISFTRQGDYPWLFRQLEIPTRVGPDDLVLRILGINVPVKQPPGHDPGRFNNSGLFRRVARSLQKIAHAETPPDIADLSPSLTVPRDVEEQGFQAFLSKLPEADRQKLASNTASYYAIVPGSSDGASGLIKRWPLRFFIETAQLVSEWSPELIPVISFGPAEQRLLKQFQTNKRWTDILEKAVILNSRIPSWREYLIFLKRARFVLTNDSGPRHAAIALRTKTVTIFGPTPLERATYAPQYERTIKLSDDCVHSCVPRMGCCQFRLGEEGVPACLMAITPSFVMRQIEQFVELEAGAGQARN